MKTLKDRLEHLQKGQSQRDFASQIGVPLNTYTAWLRGERLPSYEAIQKICTALGVSADWLLTGRDGVSRLRETSSTRHPDGTHSDAAVREVGVPYISLPSEWPGALELTKIDHRLANIERLLVKLAGGQS